MKTNAEHAAAFLKNYYADEKKQRKSLRSLAYDYGFANGQYDAELDDELLITLAKCIKTIEKYGIKLGAKDGKPLTWPETYDAYFYRALDNNLVQYAKKKKTQWKREARYSREYLGDGCDRTEVFEYELSTPQIDPEHEYEQLVQEAVTQLPPKYQDVLYMRVDGLSYKDMERVLELRAAQVKMRLMVARQLVKDYVRSRLGSGAVLPELLDDSEAE